MGVASVIKAASRPRSLRSMRSRLHPGHRRRDIQFVLHRVQHATLCRICLTATVKSCGKTEEVQPSGLHFFTFFYFYSGR